jgi:thioredoxin reductase (NADPH)
MVGQGQVKLRRQGRDANGQRFESRTRSGREGEVEGRVTAGAEIALVGAGNSAGQAAAYLATQAARVWLLARGSSLGATLSSYFVERISAQPNIKMRLQTPVNALVGHNGVLEAVSCHDPSSAEARMSVRHLFVYIGAEPNTDWLAESEVALDADGFVQTEATGTAAQWAFERAGREFSP